MPMTRCNPVEISGRDLLRLGGTVQIDDRLSWRGSADYGFYDPVNAYLLREGDDVLLVEAGVPLMAETIRRQLHIAGGDSTRLRIAVTRNEPDCISNIPVLAKDPGVERVYSPGLMNPLDYFDDVSTRFQMLSFGVEQVPIRPGSRVPVGTGRYLEAVQTPLRMLSTTWYYQAETLTLFCSDIFTDALARTPEDCVVTDSVGFTQLVPAMRAHLALRYDWLSRSNLTQIVADLNVIFEKYRIENLAPSRGCVIMGSAAAQERMEALLYILQTARRA